MFSLPLFSARLLELLDGSTARGGGGKGRGATRRGARSPLEFSGKRGRAQYIRAARPRAPLGQQTRGIGAAVDFFSSPLSPPGPVLRRLTRGETNGAACSFSRAAHPPCSVYPGRGRRPGESSEVGGRERRISLEQPSRGSLMRELGLELAPDPRTAQARSQPPLVSSSGATGPGALQTAASSRAPGDRGPPTARR